MDVHQLILARGTTGPIGGSARQRPAWLRAGGWAPTELLTVDQHRAEAVPNRQVKGFPVEYSVQNNSRTFSEPSPDVGARCLVGSGQESVGRLQHLGVCDKSRVCPLFWLGKYEWGLCGPVQYFISAASPSLLHWSCPPFQAFEYHGEY
jgi:hypothetical protein